MKKLLAVVTLPVVLVLGAASPAAADHFSNNRATFDGAAAGTAIANYSEGQGTFNAGTSVRDLAPGSYTYVVSLNGGGDQTICSFVVGASGNGSCNANDLTLKGFNTAEIKQGEVTVASARFTRQGKSECREPNQAGTEAAECPNRG